MSWKWWQPKDDPLKNKYVHELEESVDVRLQPNMERSSKELRDAFPYGR